MTPGGYDPNAREVWQEAFRIPPLKLVERGVLRDDVWELISANIRLDIVMEDIKAMNGACTIGQRRPPGGPARSARGPFGRPQEARDR